MDLTTPLLAPDDAHVEERATSYAVPIDPKPLSADQVQSLIDDVKTNPGCSKKFQRLVDLFTNRVPPGVDEAAYVKATYLAALAKGVEEPTLIDRKR